MIQSRKFLEEAQTSHSTAAASYFSKVVARGELPVEEIIETICTFLFAGVDTTNHIGLWLLLNLGRSPEVQERLYQEIMSVAPKGDFTGDQLEKMNYFKQVIRESHRLTAPGPGSVMRVLEKPIELCGYQVPPGVKIICCAAAIQMDPQFVKEPEEFNPDRWAKEAVQSRKGTPEEVIDNLMLAKPFGMGPRMCLGSRLAEAELKVFIGHLLRKWKFSYDPVKQPHKIRMRTFTEAFPYPKMTFEPRK